MARSTDCDLNTEERDIYKESSKWENDLSVLARAVSRNSSPFSDMFLRIYNLFAILTSKKTTEGSGFSAADPTSTPSDG